MKILRNTFLFGMSLFLFGCQGMDFQKQFQDFTANIVPKKNIREVAGVIFEAKSCEFSKSTRVFTCHVVVTSKFQDRNVRWESSYTNLQDDLGNTYHAIGGLGRVASVGRPGGMLIADMPYDVTLSASNVSTQATKVRAITFGSIHINGSGVVASGPFPLSGFPMVPKLQYAKVAETIDPAPKTPPSPQPIIAKVAPSFPDLSGAWNEIIFGRDMGVAQIKQNRRKLKFWNFEKPPKFSQGRLDKSGVIHARGWNLTAKLKDGGKKIVWSNGVIWIRE